MRSNALRVVLWLLLVSPALGQETVRIPIEVSPPLSRLQTTLEFSTDGDAVLLAWEEGAVRYHARCRPTRTTPRKVWKGDLLRAPGEGMAQALGDRRAERGANLDVVFVHDEARGRVWATFLTRGSWAAPPAVVGGFEGLFPIRVCERWLPRLREGPAESGLLDPFTANDVAPEGDGLPPPQPRARRLGDLVVLTPGMFNMPPAHALVARAAAHAERVLIAYTNPYGAGLRRVDQLDGRPLPAGVRGRVFAHGSPEPLISAWTQTCDRLLEVLEDARTSPLLALDPFRSRLTLVGHSQGSLAVVKARQRLIEAGLVEPGRWQVIAIAPPFRGLSVADNSVVRWLSRRVSLLAPGLPASLEDLRPARVSELLGAAQAEVSVSGYVLDEDAEDAEDASPRSDGVVSLAAARLRARRFKGLLGYDHATIFQSPAVLDAAVRDLPE